MPDLRVPRRLRSAAPILVAVVAAAGACSSSRDLSKWKSQNTYGSEMARRGFWREALFRYEKAAVLKPDNAEIQNNLGVAYESIGETSRALAAYKKALELAPQDAKIKRNYARFAEYYTSVQRASSLPAPSTPTPSPAPSTGEKPGSTGPPVAPPSVGTVPSESSPGTPPSAQNPPSPPPAPTPVPPGATLSSGEKK